MYYSDPYVTWNNVVAQGTVEITLRQHTARVALDSDKVHLAFGTSCKLSKGTCMDSEGGQTFWDIAPSDQCGFNRYGLLYEGPATKMTDLIEGRNQTVYSLSTQEIMFALLTRGHSNVCGYTVTATEHPKLVISETTKGVTFTSKAVSIDNLDIFDYIISKFVFVEKHIRKQMKDRYRDVILQHCNLERQCLENSLSIATQSPDEFAYRFIKGPGYMAVVTGKVVHIIKYRWR